MLGWLRASIDRRRRQLANYGNRIVAAIAGASSARLPNAARQGKEGTRCVRCCRGYCVYSFHLFRAGEIISPPAKRPRCNVIYSETRMSVVACDVPSGSALGKTLIERADFGTAHRCGD